MLIIHGHVNDLKCSLVKKKKKGTTNHHIIVYEILSLDVLPSIYRTSSAVNASNNDFTS